MANLKISERTATTTPVTTDIVDITVAPGSTPLSRKVTLGNLYKGLGTGTPSASTFLAGDGTWKNTEKKRGRWFLPNPATMYASDPHIILLKTDAAITITRIMLRNSLTGTEIACDLKWASDMLIGSYADAAVIDVCDTTSGVFEVTSGMDDPTIPTGKYVYLQLDATPSALIKYCLLEVDFDYD